MTRELVTRLVLVALVLLITVVFFRMIEGMVMALLVAAILAGLLGGVHRRLERLFGGRSTAAAVVTEVVLVFLILVPLGGMAGLVTAQAIKVGNNIGPWIRENLSQPDELTRRLQALPFYDSIEPYRDDILRKAGELAGSISSWLVDALGNATLGTVHFVFLFFVMLYALYFFLINGRAVLEKMLWYLPLEDRDEQRMVGKFISVTRATLKGTLLIGFVQGALGGLAFLVVGVDSWAFWAAVMMVMSIIPGLGTALVWVPAAVWLAMDGHWGLAVGMALYFVLVVGMMDNVIRPRVVGRDTQMPDLLVFLSTLGGLTFFGALGFIIGPIVGALLLTVWEIYGETFKDYLPEVGGAARPGGED